MTIGSPETDCAVALDAGGTIMKGAIVGRDGTVLAAARRPTHRESGPKAVIAAILEFADDLRGQATLTGSSPAVVGVAVPGVVDEEAGVARFSANIGWRDVPLRGELERTLGLPVWLGQDVRAGAVAEGTLGAARGVPHFVFVTLGTGVGAALVLADRAYRGAHSSAGEIGHIVVAPQGPVCNCGNRGCVEAFASAPAIVARYRALAGERRATDSAEAIIARASKGDHDAASVWRDALDALAAGIAACVTLTDPELVVVGGGLAAAGPALFEPLERALADCLTLHAVPTLAPARLGDEAGCLGAGLSAWRLLGASEEALRTIAKSSAP